MTWMCIMITFQPEELNHAGVQVLNEYTTSVIPESNQFKFNVPLKCVGSMLTL